VRTRREKCGAAAGADEGHQREEIGQRIAHRRSAMGAQMQRPCPGPGETEQRQSRQPQQPVEARAPLPLDLQSRFVHAGRGNRVGIGIRDCEKPGGIKIA
jgi:hypothetical protein